MTPRVQAVRRSTRLRATQEPKKETSAAPPHDILVLVAAQLHSRRDLATFARAGHAFIAAADPCSSVR